MTMAQKLTKEWAKDFFNNYHLGEGWSKETVTRLWNAFVNNLVHYNRLIDEETANQWYDKYYE